MTPYDYRRVCALAAEIEQSVFERGEYDYPVDNRIYWLKDLPETSELNSEIMMMNEAREQVETEIAKSLMTSEGRQNLIDYMEGELCVMCSEDELNDKFSELIPLIKCIESEE
jgi:hypothetical protein